MQETLIVSEMTPTVRTWLDLGDKLIGLTDAGEHILLANVQISPAEKPKRRQKKVDPRVGANGETPRRRGRPSRGLSLTEAGKSEAVSAA